MKNWFKKIISLVVTMAMTVSFLCGCGNQNASEIAKAMMESDAFKEAISEQSAEKSVVSENKMPEQEENQLTNNDYEKRNDNTDSTLSIDEEALRTAKIRHYYGEILWQLYCISTLPNIDVEPIDYNFHEMSENHYAIFDIDCDEEEELIIEYSTASMAGCLEVVYGYNPDTESLSIEYLGTMGVQFYDNGMIIEYLSHNHTYCIDFCPYRMAQYKSENDLYQNIAYVSAWDKNDANACSVVDKFPEQYDIDGDGVLYSISYTNDISCELEDYKNDKADYDKWYESYLGGAKEIELDFKSLDCDNFRQYTKDYLELLANIYREKNGDNYTDITDIYFENQFDLEKVEQYLVENYGFTINKDAYGNGDVDSVIFNGEEILKFDICDMGTIYYQNQKVEDITICGLYPGMEEQNALQCLEAYGFYQYDDSYNYYGEKSFITGKGIDNKFLSYELENGRISSIILRYYCAYSG